MNLESRPNGEMLDTWTTEKPAFSRASSVPGTPGVPAEAGPSALKRLAFGLAAFHGETSLSHSFVKVHNFVRITEKGGPD